MLIQCLDCFDEIHPSPTGRGPHRKRCSACQFKRRKKLGRARTLQRRAAKWGVVAELVFAEDVFERDRWLCHICGLAISEALRAVRDVGSGYEPLAPVVDHRVPLSKGGAHTFENCRTAHWTCNAKKHVDEHYSPGSVSAVIGEGMGADFQDLDNNSDGVLIDAPRCIVEGCPRFKMVSKMCQPHYHRNRKYGDPLKTKCGCGCGALVTVSPTFFGLLYMPGHGVQSNTVAPSEKLKSGLTKRRVPDYGRRKYGLTDDCLIWTGPRIKTGYGKVFIAAPTVKRKGRNVLIHRFAYELYHGEGTASGLTIDHLCGVPLCCNPCHLEAVPSKENIRRASERLTHCSAGHEFTPENVHVSREGHRTCRTCNASHYHLRRRGHEFMPDSRPGPVKRRYCVLCKAIQEVTPSFCPKGHQYTAENTRIVNGKKSCVQCSLDRTHIPTFGHSFVVDAERSTPKRRQCSVCEDRRLEPAMCVNGHPYNELTLEYTQKGHRRCAQCRLNVGHIERHGHEYVIDPESPLMARRCLTCAKIKAATPQFCPKGHEFSENNTYYSKGWRNCKECNHNRTHRREKGHDFVNDTRFRSQKIRRCRVCFDERTK